MITQLKINEIFVFGSNLAGRHGKGAALQAMKFGAIYGQGEGLQGQTYAIPTKSGGLGVLSLDNIKIGINTFIKFAKHTQQFNFLVTEIGCGLAGYEPKHIAPMFKECLKLDNVHLPDSFIKVLEQTQT